MYANFSDSGWGYHHFKYKIDLYQFFLTEKVTCLPILSDEAFLFICVYLLMLNNSGCIFCFKICYSYWGYAFFFVRVESLVLYFFFVFTHQAYCSLSLSLSVCLSLSRAFSLSLSLSLSLCVCVWKMEIPVITRNEHSMLWAHVPTSQQFHQTGTENKASIIPTDCCYLIVLS